MAMVRKSKRGGGGSRFNTSGKGGTRVRTGKDGGKNLGTPTHCAATRAHPSARGGRY